jgi:hypothetical protein
VNLEGLIHRIRCQHLTNEAQKREIIRFTEELRLLRVQLRYADENFMLLEKKYYEALKQGNP